MYQKLRSKTYLSFLGYCCHLYVYLILGFIVSSIRQSLFWWKPHSLPPRQRNKKYQFGNKEHLGLLRREGTRIVLVWYIATGDWLIVLLYVKRAWPSRFPPSIVRNFPWKTLISKTTQRPRDLEMQLGHSQYIISIERKCPLRLASLSLLKLTFLNQHTEALN